ncbi:mediator of RNA polymerase II transcription subunit 19 [Culicoides brevitarsis]|uniref:mediator of RNA polymerase II transcription subunit 19 n=1 Tax=Culicoides brevitarsis TaxID=469753 RepID=UPI00307BB374
MFNTMSSNNMYDSQPSTTGTLKTTISLGGKNPTISGPFYLMKDFSPGESELTGSTNLLAHYNLEHSYNKFSGKKIKEQLSSFLPNLPGVLDGVPQSTIHDNSTLRSVIEKPPIGGKELLPLTSFQLAAFRLHPGPLPDQYKYLSTTPTKKHKNKHKKSKYKEGGVPQETSLTDASALDTHEKKHKKQKRHEDDKERKKRKKEKKRKKQRPEHPEQRPEI